MIIFEFFGIFVIFVEILECKNVHKVINTTSFWSAISRMTCTDASCRRLQKSRFETMRFWSFYEAICKCVNFWFKIEIAVLMKFCPKKSFPKFCDFAKKNHRICRLLRKWSKMHRFEPLFLQAPAKRIVAGHTWNRGSKRVRIHHFINVFAFQNFDKNQKNAEKFKNYHNFCRLQILEQPHSRSTSWRAPEK